MLVYREWRYQQRCPMFHLPTLRPCQITLNKQPVYIGNRICTFISCCGIHFNCYSLMNVHWTLFSVSVQTDLNLNQNTMWGDLFSSLKFGCIFMNKTALLLRGYICAWIKNNSQPHLYQMRFCIIQWILNQMFVLGRI